MVHLSTHAECLTERGGTNRSNHELLDIHVGVRVRTTVEDVHHRNGKHVSVRATHVAEEGEVGRIGCRLRHGERDAEDGVRAKLALVVGAVQVDHDLVDETLLGGVEANDLGGDFVDDGVNRLLHTLAQVTALVAVTTLDGLEGTGRCTGRDCRACERTVLERDLDLDGGVAARVKNLAGANGLNAGHVAPYVVPLVRAFMGIYSPVSLSM